MEKTYLVGLIGDKYEYRPWLFSVELLELADGKLLRACESTQQIFDKMPEDFRVNPPLDRWQVASSTLVPSSLCAVYCSKDRDKIQDILEGMRYSWDVLFCSGKKGIEEGKLEYGAGRGSPVLN